MEFTQTQNSPVSSDGEFTPLENTQLEREDRTFECPITSNYTIVLNSLEKINSSFSMSHQFFEQEPFLSEILEQENSQKQNNQNIQQNQTHTSSNPHQLNIKVYKKSLIFTPTKSGCLLEGPKVKNNEIDIFYFGHPIHKRIEIDVHDDIYELIRKALAEYMRDGSFDQSLFFGTNPNLYELRFCESQGNHRPDMKLDPIESHRKISDIILDCVVLMPKKRVSRLSESRKTQVMQIMNNGLVRISLHNMEDIQIASIIISREDTLQKVYKYVEEQLNQIVNLKQSIDDEFYLPKDFEIKNLSTFILYIKKKKYLDEPNLEMVRPCRVISNIPKDLSVNLLPPIGISEASRYEEFDVTKINRRGVYQPRVLGIDQTKIYNYEETMRKQKRESSSFLNIFSQANPFTGTKQPQRFVQSIIDIQSLKGLNFLIVFKEKSIEYIARDVQQKEKILRKLRFLVNFHKQKHAITEKKPYK